jgi:hypothetical protein
MVIFYKMIILDSRASLIRPNSNISIPKMPRYVCGPQAYRKTNFIVGYNSTQKRSVSSYAEMLHTKSQNSANRSQTSSSKTSPGRHNTKKFNSSVNFGREEVNFSTSYNSQAEWMRIHNQKNRSGFT